MRGAPPKPTVLKLLDGEQHKDRIKTDEPKPRLVAPKPPEHLDPIALAEWERFGPILARLGLLTESDRASFTSYCELWSQNVRLSHELEAQNGGEIMIEIPEELNSKGEVKKASSRKLHPLLAAKQKVIAQLLPFIREFGMSPSSRTRISVPGMMDQGEFEALLD